MATTEPFLGLRRPDTNDPVSVINDLDNNYTLIGAAFDPAGSVAAQQPKALLRETAQTPTHTVATNLLNFAPVWNAPIATLRTIFANITHTGAGAASRVIEVQRNGNPIFDIDITSQVAVNGISLKGSATGNPPQLAAMGTDLDVGIQLTPKGAGSVTIPSGGLSATNNAGGAAVIMNAVDPAANPVAIAVFRRSGVTKATIFLAGTSDDLFFGDGGGTANLTLSRSGAGVTVNRGGLTVSAGGANITGNSTVLGQLGIGSTGNVVLRGTGAGGFQGFALDTYNGGATSGVIQADGNGHVAFGGSTGDVLSTGTVGKVISVRNTGSVANPPEFQFDGTGVTDSDGNGCGGFSFGDSSYAANKRVASIGVTRSGATAGNRGGAMYFYTKDNNGTLKMRAALSNIGTWGFGDNGTGAQTNSRMYLAGAIAADNPIGIQISEALTTNANGIISAGLYSSSGITVNGGVTQSRAAQAYLDNKTATVTGVLSNHNTLFLGTPTGGTTVRVIDTASGAYLSTVGAWTNNPSWAAYKDDIRYVDTKEQARLYDAFVGAWKPARYRHKGKALGDDGPAPVHQKYEYDNFFALLDDLPQEVREVICTDEQGGINTKDMDGLLAALILEQARRITSLEARLRK